MAAPPIEKKLWNLNPSVDGPDQNGDEAQCGAGNNSFVLRRRLKRKRHSLNLRKVKESKSSDFQFGDKDVPDSMPLVPPLEKEQKQSSVRIRTEREQGSIILIPYYHTVVIFLNSLLVGILQVEYQGKQVSPFSEHPANMWIFIGYVCLYCLGLAFKLQLRHNQQPSPTYCHMIDSAVLISAVVSPLSLALLFLHCSATWLYSTLSITSVILVTHHHLVVMCRGVYEKILNHFRALPVPEASVTALTVAPSTSTGSIQSEPQNRKYPNQTVILEGFE